MLAPVEVSEVAVPYTLVPQVAHEQLEADEGKHTEAEDGEDHHVGELLHRLDQSSHNGLQTCRTPHTSVSL